MEDKEKTPGWVVWAATFAQWEVVTKPGTKDESVEVKTREGSCVLYAGTNLARAKETYEFYLERDVFPVVYFREVDDLPDFGEGRFVKE